MIAFCSSPHFVEHDTGPHHPERPDRLRAIHRAVRAAGMIESPDPFPDFRIDLGAINGGGDVVATPASPALSQQKEGDAGVAPTIDSDAFRLREIEPEPAELEWIRAVHNDTYIERIRRICQAGGGVLDQGDTPVSLASYDVALRSCGAVLRAAKAVMDGEVKRAFAASRPPGHHAEPDRPMGFCLFSNIAIAARFVQKQYNIGRVAIVDFDVHHGNGTQAVFEEDPSVLFISLHQDPRTLYPGSGHEWETGIGAGEGTTINLPMKPGSDDDDYLKTFDDRVLPALHHYAPDVLFISAGFDAHRDDPLAQIELSEDGFEQMTRKLAAFADRQCQGRVISALEGGYHLRALGRSVVRHLIGLS